MRYLSQSLCDGRTTNGDEGTTTTDAACNIFQMQKRHSAVFRKKIMVCRPQMGNVLECLVRCLVQVPSKTLDDRVIKLTVFDVDRRRHNVIGHAHLSINDRKLEDGREKLLSIDLQPTEPTNARATFPVKCLLILLFSFYYGLG